MHHFFIPETSITEDIVTFPEQTGRQIQRVLRLKAGDSVIVLDNSGKMYETTVAFEGQKVTGRVLSITQADTEPCVKLRLMACVSQREKYEWILQKGTELGVTEFLPVISHRTLVQKISSIDKKRSRWETIIREAAEQSHRGKLPLLLPAMKFREVLNVIDGAACNLIAHTEKEIVPLKTVLNHNSFETFNLLVGPEGGFSKVEVIAAVQAGFQPVSLGKRILRMETASLAFVTSILYHSSNV